jgi:UrcA family protein
MYRFTTLMTVCALTLGFQSAEAAPPEAVPSIVVHFGDLDVTRGEGATALFRRLKSAAETVCAPLDDRDVARHMKFRACVQRAISTAVAQVDQAALTRYYEANTGRHNAAIKVAQK